MDVNKISDAAITISLYCQECHEIFQESTLYCVRISLNQVAKQLTHNVKITADDKSVEFLFEKFLDCIQKYLLLPHVPNLHFYYHCF